MMSRMNCLVALLFLVPLAQASDRCTDEKTFPNVTKAQLQQLIDAGAVRVIDVNSKSSYAKSHVTGAVHFDSTRDATRLFPADKSTTIVAYCGGPQCSAWKKAAEAACRQGYTDVRHFRDGISGWNKSG